MRNRRTRVLFPVYNGCEVIVILARDVAATGRRLHVDLSDAHAGFITDPARPKRGWLVLGANPDAGTIAHEASHAIRAIFACVGARTDNENFAYHLDYLVGRIHAFAKGRR